MIGVAEAGFSTTELPVTIAGAIFRAAVRMGSFHGVMSTTTPSGSVTLAATVFGRASQRSPPNSARPTPA